MTIEEDPLDPETVLWTVAKMQIFANMMSRWCLRYDISKDALQSLVSDEYDKVRRGKAPRPLL
jgi:hypothetical protein